MFLEYTINEIEIDKYNCIISILDYEVVLSRVLRNIRLPHLKFGKCIVDTIINLGKNKYRFIEINILGNGCLDINNIKYIDVSEALEEKANSILLNYPESIKHSVLTEKQIEFFLKNKRI